MLIVRTENAWQQLLKLYQITANPKCPALNYFWPTYHCRPATRPSRGERPRSHFRKADRRDVWSWKISISAGTACSRHAVRKPGQQYYIDATFKPELRPRARQLWSKNLTILANLYSKAYLVIRWQEKILPKICLNLNSNLLFVYIIYFYYRL